MAFCRLLARDNTPIVSRNGGDDYILVRIDTCNYVSVSPVAQYAGARSSKKRKQYSYPRKIRLGKEWVVVRSFEEEQDKLRAYAHKLELEIEEGDTSLIRRQAKAKYVYTIKRLRYAQEERKRKRIRDSNNAVSIVRAAFPWL